MKAILLRIVDFFNLYPLFYKYTRNTATIFMLHRFVPDQNSETSDITPSILKKYFNYLKKNNYRVLSLKEYVYALLNKEDTKKTVVFTVDDGYRDFYLYAFPVFKEYNYPATIFITSDFIEGRLFFWWDTIEYIIKQTSKKEIDLNFINIGVLQLNDSLSREKSIDKIVKYCKKIRNDEKLSIIDKIAKDLEVDIPGQPLKEYEPLNWNEIKEMNEGGIDFHPHTKTHPIISKVPFEQKKLEVINPKETIENNLSTSADIFCYPNGQPDDFDEETITVLKDAGYIAAVVGYAGFDNTKADTDMFRIRRFAIPTDEIIFKQYICGLEYFKYKYLGNS